jgi:AhpD family alkylhydroperoxidase
MEPRIKHPAFSVPGALPALQGLAKIYRTGAVSDETLELVHLRASQINGCSYCVDLGAVELQQAGVDYRKAMSVAAWRESPCFDDAERAALALSEAITRIADCTDPVPDAVWDAAAEHFDEAALASLVLCIASTNTWNRINAAVRQPAGAVG